MAEFFVFVTNLMNNFHDFAMSLFGKGSFPLVDKLLHFVIIAVVGMTIFVCIHALFEFLSRYSVVAISFVYTFTVVSVLVFAIEVQQEVTNRGYMSMSDALWGIGGFLCVFVLHTAIKNVCAKLKKGKIRVDCGGIFVAKKDCYAIKAAMENALEMAGKKEIVTHE